jgi:uncharacterized protein (TIGR03437 family)
MLSRISLVLFSIGALSAAWGQSILSCRASANPPVVRAEGVSERTGDIALDCSGGQPNQQITGNLTIFLNVNVTNRIAADGTADVFLSLDNGSGFNPLPVPATLNGVNSVMFNGVSFTLSPTGTAKLQISNLRGNASQLGLAPDSFIVAYAAFNGGLVALDSAQFTVGASQIALLGSSTGSLTCAQTGSPLPATLDFSSLIARGTEFSSTRVTEGFAAAFAPKSDWSNLDADSGVRIIARYSGFPAGAQLFVPDAIAGADADVPTAGGDMGFAASGGQYTAGRNELLLVRVNGADSNGAGGTLAVTPPATGPVTFNSVSAVSLANGSGYAVYEVVDANPSIRESAQFPTFLGLAPSGTLQPTVTSSSVNLAPISTTDVASSSAPIPRFIENTPPLDCSALQDCSAGYFPQISVDTTPLAFTVAAGGTSTQYFTIHNGGTSPLDWTVTANYTKGSGWLRIAPAQGTDNATVRVDALAAGLQPDTYTATLTVNGGQIAGAKTIPVTLNVTAAQTPSPSIQSITNAAGADQTSLVAGSLATIMGSNFAGQAVTVTFDGTPAKLIYTSAQQINLEVPPALSGKSSASVIVDVDGADSPAKAVTLAGSAPAIFNGGILNQDYSANSATAPAAANSVVQIWATGLPADGTITAKLHDLTISAPYYAGPAPGILGVQQVDIVVPSTLPAMQTWLWVCGPGAAGAQPVCSAPQKVWIQ